MAEFSRKWSPYTYAYDNPVKFIDPDGMFAGDYYKKDGTYLGNDGIDDDKVYVATSVTKNKEGLVSEAKDAQDLGVTHTDFATSANVVKHESSGDKTESLWIAHAANNAKDNNAIDWKKQNTTLNDQLTDISYSTTPESARTPLSTADNGTNANNARAAVMNVLLGYPDPTGGAVLWDGGDFLQKGLTHNKFKEYTKVSINADHLWNYAMGSKRPGSSPIAGTFVGELILGTNYSESGRGKYYSLQSTGSPSKGRSIFWKIGPK